MADARRRFFDLLVGLSLGAVAGATFMGWQGQKTFTSLYLVQTADQANVAREIAAGRGEALAARIRGELPGYVETLDSQFEDAAGREWALWAVRDAYEAAGIDPPEAIASRLATLPERAECAPPPGVAPGAPAGP
ncbi:MAG: hypothetical protein KDB94_01865 [Acidobacteria bacterium]|nr:hypothetical protein [Acidobacteriota bacterium]